MRDILLRAFETYNALIGLEINGFKIYCLTLIKDLVEDKKQHMVAYFCHHLSDNYVDLSDIYVDLSDLYVDLSDLYNDLSLIPSVEK